MVLESRTWSPSRVPFLGLGLETCELAFAIYGPGLRLELETSGLELGCFYLNETTSIFRVMNK